MQDVENRGASPEPLCSSDLHEGRTTGMSTTALAPAFFYSGRGLAPPWLAETTKGGGIHSRTSPISRPLSTLAGNPAPTALAAQRQQLALHRGGMRRRSEGRCRQSWTRGKGGCGGGGFRPRRTRGYRDLGIFIHLPYAVLDDRKI
jgi:hypothetical protein